MNGCGEVCTVLLARYFRFVFQFSQFLSRALQAAVQRSLKRVVRECTHCSQRPCAYVTSAVPGAAAVNSAQNDPVYCLQSYRQQTSRFPAVPRETDVSLLKLGCRAGTSSQSPGATCPSSTVAGWRALKVAVSSPTSSTWRVVASFDHQCWMSSPSVPTSAEKR